MQRTLSLLTEARQRSADAIHSSASKWRRLSQSRRRQQCASAEDDPCCVAPSEGALAGQLLTLPRFAGVVNGKRGVAALRRAFECGLFAPLFIQRELPSVKVDMSAVVLPCMTPLPTTTTEDEGKQEKTPQTAKDDCCPRWALEVVWPASVLLDCTLLPPLAHVLEQRLSKELQPFRCEYVQAVRRQLLFIFHCREYLEIAEFVGDALLDFVVSMRVLSENAPDDKAKLLWSRGSFTDVTSNRNLNSCLPAPLLAYARATFRMSSMKKGADLVEALFGGLAIALWVLPLHAELTAKTETLHNRSWAPMTLPRLPFPVIWACAERLRVFLGVGLRSTPAV